MTGSTGGTGRGAGGRFAVGNEIGKLGGNPQVRALAEHRRAISEAVSPAELQSVVRGLLQQALGGDVQAARVLLDRLGGPPGSTLLSLPVGDLRHPEELSALALQTVQAAASGAIRLEDAVTFTGLLQAVGQALTGWGRPPDGMELAMRDLVNPPASRAREGPSR